MKKIKIIVVFLVIFILCGCTVKETVVMDEYGKIKDRVIIPINTNGKTEDEFRSYINKITNGYNKIFKMRSYHKNIVYGEKESKILLSNYSFDNICSYVHKNIFSQYLYERVSCVEDDEFYEIKNETKHINYCYDCSTWPRLDDVSVSITLPVEAEESNADVVDDKTYTWKYDKFSSEDKDFYLRISKKALAENLENIKRKERMRKIIIRLTIASVAGILLIIGFILYRKQKNKELDY